MGRKAVVFRVLCGVFGLACLVTGCVLISVFDKLIHHEIDTSLPLKNGSDSYNNWVSPPAPIYFQIWVLDVVNPDEVISQGAKPVLQQKGPYTYRETRKKEEIAYKDNNTIVKYKENKWYVFDPSRSNGKESDSFTTVNLPMITVVNLLRYEYSWLQDLEDVILRFVANEDLFITLTPGELLWGYEDNLLKFIKDLAARFHVQFDDKFGLFYKQNGSDDGLYEIHTGIDSVDHFAEIVTWNENASLSYWTSSAANMLNGSDGTVYPPFIEKSKPYYLFSSDLCRSLVIKYAETYTLKGIDLMRFKVPKEAFVNTSYDQGFCTPKYNCLPSGLLNVSACRQSAPIVFSLPHFLDGDPDLRNRVIGMDPDLEEHQSVIDIEPTTGVVMNAAKRLQINVYLANNSHISDTKNLRDYVILPILWLNESAMIDDKSAHDFKAKVMTPMKITEAVKYGLIGLGAMIILIVLALIAKNATCKRGDTELVPVTETTPILRAT